MQDFFRYTPDYRPIKLSGDVMNFFEVLSIVQELSRVGVDATATQIAKRAGVSTYMARKLLHTMHELKLVVWQTKQHRPNVLKRVYHLTETENRVHWAYTGQLSRIWDDQP